MVTEMALQHVCVGPPYALIDQQKAQACKESGTALQALLDAEVPVRTVQGRSFSPTSTVVGALRAHFTRRPTTAEGDRVMLFEAIALPGRVTRPDDDNIATHLSWHESCGLRPNRWK